MPSTETEAAINGLEPSLCPNPLWAPKDVLVIFVLGGPGAGKGTQCAKLVDEYGFKHLSAGDLLRAEQEREGSQFGEMIKEYIREGKIVPMEVTVQLLENAMKESIEKEGKSWFLIDGFPRKMDQALKFEEAVCRSRFALFFDCPEPILEERLLKRGKTSGRSDDNVESIQKRFKTFLQTSMPVVDYLSSQGRVVKVDATPGPEDIYGVVRAKLKERGVEMPKEPKTKTTEEPTSNGVKEEQEAEVAAQ